MIKRLWEYLGTQHVYEDHIMKLRHDRYHFTPNDITRDFTILEFGDWVNIIPVRPDGRIVMVRQYRHAMKRLSLEIPGGMMGPEEEDPMVSAMREMKEETGYISDDVVHIGTVEPNPAIQNNRCHTYLARDVLLVSEQSLDPTEAIEIELLNLGEILNMIRNGEITHALVIVAFAFLMLYEGET
ncbi:MAG: NUDIX hydrolase [Deltaproteobacteria bacterium]|nr:MAG: NUDIX hydrolase [Deltaproteobacteria bacterium]